MVRNYKRKTDRQSWSEENMISAVEAVLKENFSCRQAAEKFSVPRESLRRRIVKCRENEATVNNVCKKGLGFSTVLSEKQESDLCDYILFMEERMFGLTAEDIRKLAFKLAVKTNTKHSFNSDKQMAGPDWFQKFMNRHPKLSLRKPEPTSAARATGFNKNDVTKFYDLLEATILEHKLTAREIFNVDEFGTSIVPKCVSKIVVLKGKHQVACRKSAERGQLVTAEVCFSADGQYMPPMLIFPRKRDKQRFLEGKPEGAWAEFNNNGWIDSDIFSKWFKEFIKFTKCTKESPVLLILDGHASHVKNMTVVDLAQENGVIILCLPPHCTHRLQPLDVSFMKPLSLYYAKEVQKWLRTHPNRVVSMFEIFSLFGKAFEVAATLSTAKNGFEKTGIWPFNRDLFTDTDFAPSQVDMADTENSGSSFGNVTDEDSRSFRQLIEESQHEIDNKTASAKAQDQKHQQAREILNTDSYECDSLVHDEPQNVHVVQEDELYNQNETFQTSDSDLILEDILQDSQNCIELSLPVTNADTINSVPVKVLSSVNPNIQKNLKKDKPKTKRTGYTTIISSSEYKETLLLSKTKRQPKKPKKKENSSPPVALAKNAVNVQVPVQFVQCMLPMPFQSRPELQVNENSMFNTPVHMLSPQEVPILSNVTTQRNPYVPTRPALLPVQVQPATRMFTPKIQPNIPSSSLTIRPVHCQNETQRVKPIITSSLTIRPIHNQKQVQPATLALSSPLTIRPVLH